MNQSLGCGSDQRLRDLRPNLHNQLWIKRTVSAHASLQGFALDQFHCVKAAASVRCSAKLENRTYIWMP